MQSTNKSKQGQSFIDLVVQQTGSFTDVIKEALNNNYSLHDNVPIEDAISVEAISDNSVVAALRNNLPATAYVVGRAFNQSQDYIEFVGGIGVLRIQETFRVQ